MPQAGLHWQGTQRRSCAPGAHWNVQVVRGKVTTRCLWHACKALGIGLLLMLLGACMATIGYYADQLSVAQEIRGNLTVRVKNESRGFHLNNLSYAGPIVMGVGGFIVVAACVMTFEARDSAAKVVPARFRFNQSTSCKNGKHQRSRRSTSCQTTRWDHQLGLFRMHRSPSPSRPEISRKKLTAELFEFSKNLRQKSLGVESIKKSPSAPDLAEKGGGASAQRKKAARHAGCALLNAELLKRHAVSVDYAGFQAQSVDSANIEYNQISESQTSMAMDIHVAYKGGPATLRIQDRSDTAQRHQLLRQKRIDDEETEPKKNRGGNSRAKGEAFSKYPDDFVSRKRGSVDLRTLEELDWRRESKKGSSANFRLASTGDRKGSAHRKASLDFRRSPDERAFRFRDYRKYSVDKFASEQQCQLPTELAEPRPRANTGESGRRYRQSKLYHSRSDDNRRRSFDKYKVDPHSSRYSLNAQAVAETALAHEYELKYYTTTNSLDTEGSRGECSDDSHTVDIEENGPFSTDGPLPTESDALLEEPELENLTEVDVETSGDDIDLPDDPGAPLSTPDVANSNGEA